MTQESGRYVQPVVLGVDPGGRTTGLAVRRDRDCLAFALVDRDYDLDHYLQTVVKTVHQLDREHACDIVAVEGLVEPNPHMGLANVRGLIDTAQVLGAIRHALAGDAVIVRPASHGAIPKPIRTLPKGEARDRACLAYLRQHYPSRLIGKTERSGTGQLRHARSAFDVAGAARTTLQHQIGLTS